MKYFRPKPRTKYAGVYAIVLNKTGQMYIGSSNDMTGRFAHHRFCLRHGTHKNRNLQRAWHEYGESSFEFVQLERCSNYREREQQLISTTDNCFNIGPFSGPSENARLAALKRWQNPHYRIKQLIARQTSPH